MQACCDTSVQEFTLPSNVKATTSVVEALTDAQFAVHAVPVQHSRRFLDSIKVGIACTCTCSVQGLRPSMPFCGVPL
jgi:glycerol-3-phosphate dehydrogenase